MSGFEKLQYDHAQILYILDLGLKKCFYENFIKTAKVSWENPKAFWRYRFFFQGEGCTCTLSPIVYGQSANWRKTINEMGANIPGGNFLGVYFPRTVIAICYMKLN